MPTLLEKIVAFITANATPAVQAAALQLVYGAFALIEALWGAAGSPVAPAPPALQPHEQARIQQIHGILGGIAGGGKLLGLLQKLEAFIAANPQLLAWLESLLGIKLPPIVLPVVPPTTTP